MVGKKEETKPEGEEANKSTQLKPTPAITKPVPSPVVPKGIPSHT